MQFRRVSLAALMFCGFVLMAQQPITVAKLKEFIKSTIELKNPDKQVAADVTAFRLTEKFTLADLQELQDAGVGPKTLTALAALVTKTASLNPPPRVAPGAKPAGPPAPGAAEQRQAIRDAREWALSYVKSLPDFVCLEDTERSVDPHFQPGMEGSWTHQDRVREKLTFFDHKENYELFQHNDTAVIAKNAESLGGARSTGEWASLVAEIFEPSTDTDFHWVAWKNVRGKLTYEYQYKVDRQHSQETVAHGETQKVITGFHGSVFIQKGTNAVLRVTVTPEIPPDFPVQDVDQTVDYDYQRIGAQQGSDCAAGTDDCFLLPLKSVVQMRDGHLGSKNDIRWFSYRKYSADTKIEFDENDTAPEPDSQKKGQAPPKN